MEVQAEPSPETWIWNALPYAASQLSTTWQMATLPPRSTCSHCGSLNALDQRVPGLPSTAAAAGVPPCSTDEAVAGLFDESKVAACARCGGTATTAALSSSSSIAAKAAVRGNSLMVFLPGGSATSRRRPAGTA